MPSETEHPFAGAVREHIDEILHTRKEHLEQMAAAFIKQVGSVEASRYQLVEEREGFETRWFFRRMY